jgi:hypothetical protein
VIDHPAESWALNSVRLASETTLAESFASNYRELIVLARANVVIACDPEGTYGPIGDHQT